MSQFLNPAEVARARKMMLKLPPGERDAFWKGWETAVDLIRQTRDDAPAMGDPQVPVSAFAHQLVKGLGALRALIEGLIEPDEVPGIVGKPEGRP